MNEKSFVDSLFFHFDPFASLFFSFVCILIKSILIHEYQHKSIRINTSPTRINTILTRVRHKSTRINTSLTRVRHESTRVQNRFRTWQDLHFCTVSNFEIFKCIVKSLIATSTYFLLKYYWEKRNCKLFFGHPNRYTGLLNGLNTSLLLTPKMWSMHISTN